MNAALLLRTTALLALSFGALAVAAGGRVGVGAAVVIGDAR